MTTKRQRPAYLGRRPRHALTTANPVQVALTGCSVLTPAERADMLAPMHAAIEALQFGGFSVQHWRNLADHFGVAEALCGLGIANDHLEKFEAAQQALYALSERWQDRKTWTARGDELLAVKDAAEIHEIQLRFASINEVRRAAVRRQQVNEAARAGKLPGAVVVDLQGETA